MERTELLSQECVSLMETVLAIKVSDDPYIPSILGRRAVSQIRDRLLFFAGSRLSDVPAAYFSDLTVPMIYSYYINNTHQTDDPIMPSDMQMRTDMTHIMSCMKTFNPVSVY